VLLFIEEKIQFKNNVVHGMKQFNVKENHYQKKDVNFLEKQLLQNLKKDVNGDLLEKIKELKDVVFIQNNVKEINVKNPKNVQ